MVVDGVVGGALEVAVRNPFVVELFCFFSGDIYLGPSSVAPHRALKYSSVERCFCQLRGGVGG